MHELVGLYEISRPALRAAEPKKQNNKKGEEISAPGAVVATPHQGWHQKGKPQKGNEGLT